MYSTRAPSMDLDNGMERHNVKLKFEICIMALWHQLNSVAILYGMVPVAYSNFMLNLIPSAGLTQQCWVSYDTSAPLCRFTVQGRILQSADSICTHDVAKMPKLVLCSSREWYSFQIRNRPWQSQNYSKVIV